MGVMHIPGHDHQKPQEVTLEEIQAVLGDCHLCPLGQTRNKIVFGVGNPNARVMFIGEGPGKNASPSWVRPATTWTRFSPRRASGERTYTSPTWSSAARLATATLGRRR